MTKDNWFYAESKEDLDELLEMFWEFHDFRITDIHCDLKDNCVDVNLEYDTGDMWVLLRFCDVVQMNYVPDEYEVGWLSGTEFF